MRSTFLLLAGVVLFAAGAGAAEPTESKVTFSSSGKDVTMEVFSAGAGPGILVLHGADGLGGPTAVAYRTLCRELARRGYVAFLPHYFESTGTKTSTHLEDLKNFSTWITTLKDAIAKAKTVEGVKGEKVAMVGFSLGSFLSLSVSTQDKDVAAVIEFFGGLPPGQARNAKSMPPVLILHGDADPIVPVAQAHRLEEILKENHVTYEIKIYAGQGHGFRGEARVDSMRRSAEFLGKYFPVKGGK